MAIAPVLTVSGVCSLCVPMTININSPSTRFIEKPSELTLVLYTSRVPAGFPSPADDHLDDKLDLNLHLIRRPAATFFVRANGESMKEAGIFDGDLLIVDRAIAPQASDIVIAVIDGELTVKRLLQPKWQLLEPSNRLCPFIWLIGVLVEKRPMLVGVLTVPSS
jgi:DNA polymerase V